MIQVHLIFQIASVVTHQPYWSLIYLILDYYVTETTTRMGKIRIVHIHVTY